MGPGLGMGMEDLGSAPVLPASVPTWALTAVRREGVVILGVTLVRLLGCWMREVLLGLIIACNVHCTHTHTCNERVAPQQRSNPHALYPFDVLYPARLPHRTRPPEVGWCVYVYTKKAVVYVTCTWPLVSHSCRDVEVYKYQYGSISQLVEVEHGSWASILS